MSKTNKTWHPNFIKYMNIIANHPNYEGLPIQRKEDGSLSWIAPAQSEIGKARKIWCEDKAKELGFPVEPGVYAKVMREIHPTKWKVCQICGKSMSIYYHYPTVNCLRAINKRFKIQYRETDHISVIWDDLIKNGFEPSDVASFFIAYGRLDLPSTQTDKNVIIDALESQCRNNGLAILSPGAMSNFPDRFDGFHTYNRCCRSLQDAGRSKENLKSYTRDRRAYEYWSDGNIHAANQFMGSPFFNGISADHVGPISLGFIHDPHYLRPMTSGDNSAKRDRLRYEDIRLIQDIENTTGINAMSWFSQRIWAYIETNHILNQELISGFYRNTLKQNMSNYMFILYSVLANCGKIGQDFLIDNVLSKNFDCFNYSYSFDSYGNIVSKTERHFTERSNNELERYKRIAFASLVDFHEKENRSMKNDLTSNEFSKLEELNKMINDKDDDAYHAFLDLIDDVQSRLITNLENATR